MKNIIAEKKLILQFDQSPSHQVAVKAISQASGELQFHRPEGFKSSIILLTRSLIF